jgi:hypothetical protein
MDSADSLLCISNTHADAESVIRSLSDSGVDMTKLSLLGKGYHSEEHPLGFYTAKDKIRAWGGVGAFWGGLWGLLLAPAVFVIPGFGLIAMGGPVVAALFAALEGAVLLGGASAVGAALTMIGVPQHLVIKYETALKSEQYVLIMHGNKSEVAMARSILSKSGIGAEAHKPPMLHALVTQGAPAAPPV